MLHRKLAKTLLLLTFFAYQVAAGTATQIILQQNSVLEKKISEIEEEKAQLQKKLTDSLSTHSEASKTQEKEAVDLKVLVDDLEAKLREKGKEMESTEKRFLLIDLDIASKYVQLILVLNTVDNIKIRTQTNLGLTFLF